MTSTARQLTVGAQELFTGVESLQNSFQHLLDALRVSEKRFSEALQSLPFPAVLLNTAGVVTFCNADLLARTGLQLPAVLNREWFSLWLTGQAAERERAGFRDALRHRLVPPPLRCQVPAADGKGRTFFWSYNLLRNEHGEIIGATCLAEDVTERQQVQEALRRTREGFQLLVEASPDAVLVQRDGRLVYANPRAVSLLGCSAAEDLLGRPLLEVVQPSQRAEVLERLQEALKQDRPLPPFELQLMGPDGAPVESEVIMLRLEYGGGPALLALARDIRERKQMEERLRQADRLSALGGLAAGVAHQVNNPLTHIMANLERVGALAAGALEGLSARAASDPSLRTTVRVMDELVQTLLGTRESTERVRLIIRDLRGLATAEDTRSGMVDVARALDAAFKVAAHELRHRARVHKHVEEVPLTEANESRLVQALVHLLVHRAQCIPVGAADRHELQATVRPAAEGRILLEVVDTGAPAPPGGDGTEAGGLALCHGILGAYGGEFLQSTTVDGRNRIQVFLPAIPAPPRPETRGRVLVVDDEMPILVVACRVLSPDHEVVAVNRARDAIECLAAGAQFDVILCDLMMPELSGMELYEEINRRFPDHAARVIFMTGGTFTAGSQLFLRRVTNPCLEKPFDERTLKSFVRTYVGVSAAAGRGR